VLCKINEYQRYWQTIKNAIVTAAISKPISTTGQGGHRPDYHPKGE